MKNAKVLNIIPSCGCDKIMPIALVYMFYVILHGHISPGGGFQGGVLAAAVLVYIYIGYGYKTVIATVPSELMRNTEGVALVAYIAIAVCGIAFGAQFCENFAYANGQAGYLISSGTISWMDEAVGLNVVSGVSVIIISLLGIIQIADDKEEENK